MSLAIDVDDVVAVLIAGAWYEVKDRSFALDAYEYVWRAGSSARRARDDDPMVLQAGGQYGITAQGYTFESVGSGKLSGPLTAIQAVRTELSDSDSD